MPGEVYGKRSGWGCLLPGEVLSSYKGQGLKLNLMMYVGCAIQAMP